MSWPVKGVCCGSSFDAMKIYSLALQLHLDCSNFCLLKKSACCAALLSYLYHNQSTAIASPTDFIYLINWLINLTVVGWVLRILVWRLTIPEPLILTLVMPQSLFSYTAPELVDFCLLFEILGWVWKMKENVIRIYSLINHWLSLN